MTHDGSQAPQMITAAQHCASSRGESTAGDEEVRPGSELGWTPEASGCPWHAFRGEHCHQQAPQRSLFPLRRNTLWPLPLPPAHALVLTAGTEPWALSPEHWAPLTKHQSLSTGHWALSPGHEHWAPSTEHQLDESENRRDWSQVEMHEDIQKGTKYTVPSHRQSQDDRKGHICGDYMGAA